jgi:ATP-binding cassette, subfamily B, bacterial
MHVNDPGERSEVMPIRPLATFLSRAAAAAVARWTALRSAFGLLWQYAPVSSAALLAVGFVVGVATPLAVWAMQGLINALARPGVAWPAVAPWLALLFGAFLLRDAGRGATIWLASVAREHMDAGLRQRLYAQSLALPLAAFEQPDYYSKLETGRAALGGPFVFVLQHLSTLVSSLIGLGGLLLLYARVHWLLAAILLATAVLRAQIGIAQSRAFNRLQSGSSPLRREVNYWSGLLASRDSAPEIRLFGLASHFLAQWQTVFGRYLTETLTVRRQMAGRGIAGVALQEGVALVSVVALLALGLRQDVSIGTVVALLYGLRRFGDLTGTLANTLRILGDRWATVANLQAFLALPVEGRTAAPHAVPRPIREGVRFHDVSFRYPGADRAALQGVNLTLRPGEHLALVGENGSGKTTLTRLLLGLYQPTSGRITVDGIDLADLDPGAWRQEATAVFQDFGRYPTSVVENIAYADVTLLPADRQPTGPAAPRVVQAALRSGAAEFIDTLPNGYATLLGKVFEGAEDLSAGQWQRLALARAYLREAQVVVLDEPTAALDPRGEVEVYRQFGAAAAGRCAVFISHRLGSARLADRIIVLQAGSVVEEGSHEALLAANGEYARMYRLQAGWYRQDDAGRSTP